MPLPFATCWSETNEGPCSAGEMLSSQSKNNQVLNDDCQNEKLKIAWLVLIDFI